MKQALAIIIVCVAALNLGACTTKNPEDERRLERLSEEAIAAYKLLGAYDGALAGKVEPSLRYVQPLPSKRRLDAIVGASGKDQAYLLSDSGPTEAVLALPRSGLGSGYVCVALSHAQAGYVRERLLDCYDDLVRARLDRIAEVMEDDFERGRRQAAEQGVEVLEGLPYDLERGNGDRSAAWRLEQRSLSGRVFSLTKLDDGRVWRTCWRDLDGDEVVSCTSNGTFVRRWPDLDHS